MLCASRGYEVDTEMGLEWETFSRYECRANAGVKLKMFLDLFADFKIVV